MSGAEAITAVQLVDACIGIVKTIIDIGHAVSDAQGLLPKLRNLLEKLPAIEELLESAHDNFEEGKVADDVSKSAQPILKQCEQALGNLREILRKACPKDGDNRSKRIWKGAKTVFYGRDSQVQKLLEVVLDNLKLLEQKEIYAIGDKLDELQELTEALGREDSGKYTHSGQGNIIANEGGNPTNYVQGGSNNRQIISHGAYYEGDMTYYGQQPLSTTQLCLQSLAFPNYRRREDTKVKTSGTCDWVFGHDQYRNWFQKGGVLLIEGRPGTGKSTLMESIIQTDLVQKQGLKPDAFVASFFFYRRGNPLQYSALGLFRSLLHQLLSLDEDLLATFASDTKFEERCKKEGEPGIGKKWDWAQSDLQDRSKEYIQKFLRNRYLQLYIDALDESGETYVRDLWHYLKELYGQNQSRLSICISCRPYPNVIYNPDYYIAVESENQQDITMYLRIAFQTEEKWHSQSDLEEIEHALQSKASGVFQWIVLVVKRVLTLRGESKDRILQEIRKVPAELSALYEDVLRSLIKENKEDGVQALRILRWITFAARPLSLGELRYAVVTDSGLPSEPTEPHKQSKHWCDSDNIMADRVKRLSRGLVKVLQDHEGLQTVQFDHESVKEYMSQGGILLLEKETHQEIGFEDVEVRAHYILCKASIQCLASLETQTRQAGQQSSEIPLTKYAIHYWMTHAKTVEDKEFPLGQMIMEHTKWPSNEIWAQWQIRRDPFYWGIQHITLQHVASMYGLSSVLKEVIKKSKKRNLKKLRQSLGMLPWRAYDWDASDNNGQTPLSWAADGGHGGVVKALLATGKVDVDSKDKYGGWTPLWRAADGGHEGVVKALLATGKVDVDSKDNDGRTPLSRASAGGHEGVVKVLK